jgi:ABC-type oligopeptide transport system substrate-binding subunit
MKKILSIRIILLICLLGAMVYLIGCTPSVSIHTGSISGTVKTPYPGEQLDFWPCAARVDVSSSGQFTVSSYSDGSYTLNKVPVGQHTITVFKHGFLTAQKTVEVIEGEITSDVDFTLESKVPLDQLGKTYYYGFNLDITPFNNLKVRQAINYAIDKQTLLDEINTEFGVSNVMAQGPLPTDMIGYNSSLAGYSYDVVEAQTLLSQAGYPEGFSTDLYYNISDFHYSIAQKIQTYLAQVGINAELHGIEWTELLGLVDQGELPFFRLGWTADTPDPTDYLYCLYHSASIYNAVHYNNTTIDNLIEQAWETIDETEFIQLIQQIESTIVDDAPAIYIYH